MIDISELTLDEFYKAFSAKNCNSNEETTSWNTACEWSRNKDTVMIFLNGEHHTTWNPKPAI